MDPLSALGVVSTVLQFVDFGFKLVSRLSEYSKAGPREVMQSMHSVNTQLPLVLNALGRIKTEEDVEVLDTDARCILRGVIAGCTKLASEIDDMLNKVKYTPGESLGLKFRKVLGSFKYDERVKEIGMNLQSYVQVLILHHVIDAKDVPSRPLDDAKYFDITEKLVPGHVRREKLIAKLDAAFAQLFAYQSIQVQIVVLKGDQGVGKTQLAVDYCHETYNQGQFQTIFFLRASNPEVLSRSLENVTGSIRRSIKGTRQEKIDFAMSFFGERWHPWLLVLDNYNPKAFDGTELMDLLPRKGFGGILITTQHGVNFESIIEVRRYLQPQEEESMRRSMTKALIDKDLFKVQQCVEDGANVDGKSVSDPHHVGRHDGEQPFIVFAASNGAEGVVKYLLEEGANPHPTAVEDSAFHAAVLRNHPAVLDVLLDFEDSRTMRKASRYYDVLMETALTLDRAGIARTLMARRGTVLSANLFVRSVQKGCSESLRLFEEMKIFPNDAYDWELSIKGTIWMNKTETALQLLKIKPDLVRTFGPMALALAVEYERKQLVEYLLEHGCDPNVPDGEGHLPLSIAVHLDNIELTHLLLAKGADPDLTGGPGRITIARASRGHFSNATKILLSTPAPDREKRARMLQKAMGRAIDDGSSHLALEILEAADQTGINRDVFGAAGSKKSTPVIQALQNGDLVLARFFIKQKFPLDGRDEVQDTCFHIAARYGYEGVVRALLDTKMDTAVRNKFGNTPLHLAASKGHVEILQLLLRKGADSTLENKLGETPRDMAQDAKRREVVEILDALESS